MKKSFIVVAVLTLAILAVATVLTGGMLVYFLSVPSFLLVVVPAVLMSLANFSLGEFLGAYSVGFRAATNRAELEKAAIFHDAMGRYLIASGVLGTFMGVIVMLVNLNADRSVVGQGFSVSLLTVFYAIVFYMVFVVPFRAGVAKRLVEFDEMI